MLNIPTPNLHRIKIEDMDLVNEKCNNTFLRQYLFNTFYPSIAKSTLILKDYDKSKISAIRTKYLKFPVPPKCKEIHFKTINNICPSNEFINKRFKSAVDNCYICKTNVETMEHLFFECEIIQDIWKSLHDLILSSSINIDFWSFQNIHVGVILKN